MAMKTLGQLLGGGPLEVYDAVSNDQGLTFNLSHRTFGIGNSSSGTSGIELFKVNDHIVVAVHLDEGTHGNIPLIFKGLNKNDILSADQVTPFGGRIDLMDTPEEVSGGGVSFTVWADNINLPAAAGGAALTSNHPFPRSFYVDLGIKPIPEPASAEAFILGSGSVLLGHRQGGAPRRTAAS